MCKPAFQQRITRGKMKIAFLISNYLPSRGGQERFLSRLIGAIDKKEHEIHVYASRFEEPAEPGVFRHTVKVPAKNSFLKTIFFIAGARAMLQNGRYDIVSAMTRFYPADIYRMGSGLHRVWLRKKSDSFTGRLISYLRPFNRLALFIESRIFDIRNCSYIIANSNLCRRQLIQNYSYPPERVKVVYNGIDHRLFNPGLRGKHREQVLTELNLPPEQPVGIFVSMNLKRKGLDVLIKAMSLAKNKRLSLIVAGRGRFKSYLDLAKRLGVAGRVRFVGQVGDVKPYYGAADFLVLPTLYDPFANVCLEALACGLPVITTEDNGASELIHDGQNGFTVADPRDPPELAAALDSVSAEGALPEFSKEARKSSLPFTVERNASETIATYREALREKENARGRQTGFFSVNEAYRELLRAHRLGSFAAFLNHGGRTLLKDKGARTISRIDLKGGESLYIKIHRAPSGRDLFKNPLPMRSRESEAASEWRYMAALNAAGVRTMDAVAYGEQKTGSRGKRSFLVTAQARGEKLEEIAPFLKGKFRKKRCIICSLAETVRKLHGAGFNHRDLYLSHIFYDGKDDENPVSLIDLQRLQRRAKGFNRWIIKDLAALNYSSPERAITKSDRMRFLLLYLGKRRLDAKGKSAARRVLRKTAKIKRHDRKKRAG
jgi:UDP-glucose:(heptosyl)LPS alpha-1,3-glucosyltransferase